MENIRKSNPSISGILLMALVVIMSVVGAFAQQKTEKKDNDRPTGKLYEMATQTGKKHAYLGFRSDRSVIAADLKEIMRRSSDVIVGRALKNRGFLNEKGDEIHKIVTVYVQNVIKGSLINGSGIDVKTLGGLWLYSDGTAVSWRPIDERPVHDGLSYVFFLTKKDEYYVPSLGAQSVYEIEFDTNSILPNDMSKKDPVVINYQNAPLREFLDEVKMLAAEELGVTGDKGHNAVNRF